jgi:signal recognition particle receptor subunit beta
LSTRPVKNDRHIAPGRIVTVIARRFPRFFELVRGIDIAACLLDYICAYDLKQHSASSVMAWYDRDSLVTMAFSPNLTTIIVTFLIAILLPIFLHVFVYKPAVKSSIPHFALLGPSGSGKTALVAQVSSHRLQKANLTAQFERGELSPTHTSISPITVEATLPSDITPASLQYRSENDILPAKKVVFTDTPGHSKLRHSALETLESSKGKPLSGVLFVVDAAAVGSDEAASSSELIEAATYLHDVLLQLQKQFIQSKSKSKNLAFLIAANKMDLFTALPENMVKAVLQQEITKLRKTRSRGIASITQSTSAEGLDFGSGNVAEDDDEAEVLGGASSGDFKFNQLEEWGIDVTVVGGSVSEGEAGVRKWWEWIAELL